MRNTLYFGDNLTILREHVADETNIQPVSHPHQNTKVVILFSVNIAEVEGVTT